MDTKTRKDRARRLALLDENAPAAKPAAPPPLPPELARQKDEPRGTGGKK